MARFVKKTALAIGFLLIVTSLPALIMIGPPYVVYLICTMEPSPCP